MRDFEIELGLLIDEWSEIIDLDDIIEAMDIYVEGLEERRERGLGSRLPVD